MRRGSYPHFLEDKPNSGVKVFHLVLEPRELSRRLYVVLLQLLDFL